MCEKLARLVDAGLKPGDILINNSTGLRGTVTDISSASPPFLGIEVKVAPPISSLDAAHQARLESIHTNGFKNCDVQLIP